MTSKSTHILCNKGDFVFSIFCFNFDAQLSKNVQRFVNLYAYVGIHQVIILFFDNYQGFHAFKVAAV